MNFFDQVYFVETELPATMKKEILKSNGIQNGSLKYLSIDRLVCVLNYLLLGSFKKSFLTGDG